jgi:hypothetical protein
MAEEAGLHVVGESPHAHRSRLEGFAYAPPPGERHQTGTLQSILKDLDVKM